jgi:hypothetical protein
MSTGVPGTVVGSICTKILQFIIHAVLESTQYILRRLPVFTALYVAFAKNFGHDQCRIRAGQKNDS